MRRFLDNIYALTVVLCFFVGMFVGTGVHVIHERRHIEALQKEVERGQKIMRYMGEGNPIITRQVCDYCHKRKERYRNG